MPHGRKRFIHEKILNKLKYSPVLAVQGARQTGKSFFFREVLTKESKTSRYITFDYPSIAESARQDPETFLARNSEAHPLILDEAQKVPLIFDVIKATVDQRRIPGKYILLGSTEFSKMTMVREALTGRITKIRFFPMTILEALELKQSEMKLPFFLNRKEKIRIKRTQFFNHLERGGMPGIFWIRNAEERLNAVQDWFELTVQRDVHTFPKIRVESDLCRKLLELIATMSEPTAGELAKATRKDIRKVRSHLMVLEALFVVVSVSPHRLSTGKPLYYLLDCGLAHYLKAPLLRQLETLFLQEYLAKRSWVLNPQAQHEIFYYRTTKGTRISFLEETEDYVAALQILPDPQVTAKNFQALVSLGKKIKLELKRPPILFAFSPTEYLPAPSNIKIILWESLG